MGSLKAGAPERPFVALVLAASRGPRDPVARAQGVSHKCLVRVGGVPMLLRVIEALRASSRVARVALCIDGPGPIRLAPGIDQLIRSGDLILLPSEASPSRSVLRAVSLLADPFPLLVTTADHPLLAPEMVDLFCTEAVRVSVDVAVGLAPAALVLGRYPKARRTFIRFRDGLYCGCNLFTLTTPAGLRAVAFWDRVERHRKRPWRIVQGFGAASLLLYLFGRLTLDGAMRRASKRLGLNVVAVKLPFSEAAIDVDKPADLALVEEILAGRS